MSLKVPSGLKITSFISRNSPFNLDGEHLAQKRKLKKRTRLLTSSSFLFFFALNGSDVALKDVCDQWMLVQKVRKESTHQREAEKNTASLQ